MLEYHLQYRFHGVWMDYGWKTRDLSEMKQKLSQARSEVQKSLGRREIALRYVERLRRP